VRQPCHPPIEIYTGSRIHNRFSREECDSGGWIIDHNAMVPKGSSPSTDPHAPAGPMMVAFPSFCLKPNDQEKQGRPLVMSERTSHRWSTLSSLDGSLTIQRQSFQLLCRKYSSSVSDPQLCRAAAGMTSLCVPSTFQGSGRGARKSAEQLAASAQNDKGLTDSTPYSPSDSPVKGSGQTGDEAPQQRDGAVQDNGGPPLLRRPLGSNGRSTQRAAD